MFRHIRTKYFDRQRNDIPSRASIGNTSQAAELRGEETRDSKREAWSNNIYFVSPDVEPVAG